MEAKTVMTGRTDADRASEARTRRRAKILDVARDLARTGWHEDHTTILRELEAIEGFAAVQTRLEDPAFCAQLDRLCAMARRT